MSQGVNIEEIFSQAAKIDSQADRAVYLDRACAGDAGLRERVESLLAAHEKAESFLEVATGEMPAVMNPAATIEPTFRPITESPGTVVGRYKLLQQIGEGGMGVVYMAEQEKPVRRRVALKIIKPGMDSAQVIARFEAERQALAMMDHPNIARVLDAGTTDTGRPYFVMELVQGIPITQYCDDKQLDTHARLELFIEVCNAIQHAHQKGIIHRDLKPSNVLIAIYDAKPVPKIIDFGVAKALHQRLTEKTMFTQFGAVVGTLEYMSPEQADMDLMGTDTRSDIYSLGVLLYELLTGSTPLDGKKLRSLGYAEMLKTIREVDPPKPSTRLSQSRQEMGAISAKRHTEPRRLQKMVAGDLDWIVMKCLEKDRTRRYETANGLAMDIQRHLQDEAVTASPPGQLYKLQKLVRRNKLVFGAIGCVICALMLGTIVSTWEAVRATHSQHDAQTARKQAEVNEQTAVDAQAQEAIQRRKAESLAVENENNYQTARQNLYAADMASVAQAVDQTDFARARQLLDFQRPKPGESDLRGVEWRYLWAASRGDQLARLEIGNSVASVAVSPDGRLIAAGDEDGLTGLWDSTTLQPVATLAEKKPLHRCRVLQFSPDGKTLAMCLYDGVKIWDVGSRKFVKEIPDRQFHYLAFSPDGKLLAVTNGSSTLFYNTATWETLPSLAESGGIVAFSPDGSRLATTHGSTKIWDVASRSPVRSFDTSEPLSICFSADGGTVFTAGYAEGVRFWNLVDAAKEPKLLEQSFIQTMSLSPDGKLLACGANNGHIELWNWNDKQLLRVFYGHQSAIRALAFAHDGKTLVSGSADGTVRLWSAQLAAAPSTMSIALVENFEFGGGCCKFSADGKWLAARSQDAIQIVDVEHRRVRSLLPTPALPVGFLPDGRTLLAINIAQADQIARRGGRAQSTGERSTDQVELWDCQTRTKQATPLHNLPPVGVAAFAMSPDGRQIAITILTSAGAGTRVRHFFSINPPTGECAALDLELAPNRSGGLAFSPDGHYLAVGNGAHGTLLCHWPHATDFVTLPAQANVQKPVFSIDGARLVTDDQRGEVRVWEVPSGKLLLTLAGQGTGIDSASISADVLTLATTAANTARLWNLWTQREMMSFADTKSIEFSPDGRVIAKVTTMHELYLAHLPTLNEIDNPQPQTLAEAAKPRPDVFQPVIQEIDTPVK